MDKSLSPNSMVFSLPGSEVFERAGADGTGDAFLVHPFDVKATSERWNLVGECDVDDLTVDLNEAPSIDHLDKRTYEDLVSRSVDACKNGMGKVVTSRIAQHHGSLQVGASLKNLRTSFPNALVYLLNSSRYGVWMGATPEVLVERVPNGFHTVALAGTKWNDDLFEEKEFQEQLLVSTDILGKLQDVAVEVSDVREVPYGPIRHLKTDMHWEDERSLEEIAELLHPTPAVCGYPSAHANRFIEEHEGYNRSLYTGYLGTTGDEGRIFVNLRCMQLFRGQQWFYVGGGVNALSNPSTEWEETERKMNALKSALAYD